MQANLDFRRDSGYATYGVMRAELHALRGLKNDALDALERVEETRTIYLGWRFHLVQNRNFDGIRDHPRFVALLERVKAEMERQRTELRNNRRSNNQIPL
jgi:hypothetical protein